jgi:hypothetical protein
MKFGVVRVTNLPRRIKKGQFCEGVTTNLKADMQPLLLGTYSKEGAFLTYQAPPLDRQQLSWYRDGWYHSMDTGPSQSARQTAVDEMKEILERPHIIWNYLRNPALDSNSGYFCGRFPF